MATAINMGLKKRWRLKFLRILAPIPCPATDSCCWQLGNLLFSRIIRIWRVILQEWIMQTVLLQFVMTHHLSSVFLFSPSYTKKIILIQRALLVYRNTKAHETKCLMKQSVVSYFIFELSTFEFWKKSSCEWGISNNFLWYLVRIKLTPVPFFPSG